MDLTSTLESVRRELAERLNAHVAYGEPVSKDGVTVIPVARVAIGFGAGTGEAHRGDGDAPAAGGGGGGGGGVVQPLGFIEVTDMGARWVPLEPSRAEITLRAIALAAVLAPFGGRRFLFLRLLMLFGAQLLIGRMFRPNLPELPEGMRFGRLAGQPG